MGAEIRHVAKVQPLEALADRVRMLKDDGRSVVLCHGDYDRLDLRDVQHFREAKRLGDVLVVAIAPREPGDLATDDERAELLAAVDVIDYVTIAPSRDAADAVRAIAPSVYAPSPRTLIEGPRLATASEDAADGPALSVNTSADDARPASSQLDGLSPEARAFVDRIRTRYPRATIHRHLDSLRQLKILLVGEAILDEYVYCDALGKSGKEPVLAMRYISRERHAGGALAIANHLSTFCQTVDLFTYLGDRDSHEEEIRDHLARNVFPTFIHKTDSPTIVKRRFVDAYSRSKMFAVYDLNDESLEPLEEDALCSAVEARLPDCDLVVVADFGHGLITESLVDLLCAKAPFLAVNTQLNAANMGYHTISKYRRADYVSIHEGEIRLDSRSRKGDLRVLMRNLADHLASQVIMVTRGKYGSLLYHHRDGFVHCPAFASKIVDRVGAGDAVLSLTSLCAARGVPVDLLSFLGNVIGAEAVSIVGNRASIDRDRMDRAIEGLLQPPENQRGALVA